MTFGEWSKKKSEEKLSADVGVSTTSKTTFGEWKQAQDQVRAARNTALKLSKDISVREPLAASSGNYTADKYAVVGKNAEHMALFAEAQKKRAEETEKHLSLDLGLEADKLAELEAEIEKKQTATNETATAEYNERLKNTPAAGRYTGPNPYSIADAKTPELDALRKQYDERREEYLTAEQMQLAAKQGSEVNYDARKRMDAPRAILPSKIEKTAYAAERERVTRENAAAFGGKFLGGGAESVDMDAWRAIGGDKMVSDIALLKDSLERSKDLYSSKQIEERKLDIENAENALTAKYLEYVAQNDPDRAKYIARGKELQAEYDKIYNRSGNIGVGIVSGNLNRQENTMSDKQHETFLYWQGKGGADYRTAIERGINAIMTEEDRVRLEAQAKESPLGSLAPWLINTVASPGAAIDMWGTKLQGKAYDPNSLLSRGARDAGTISEALIENIESPAGKWWAQLGLSTTQFLAHLPLGPAGVALMGAEAMGQTAYDAYQNGASVDQALALGTVAGAAEIALEAIPFNDILKAFKGAGVDGVAMDAIRKQLMDGMYKEASKALGKELTLGVVKSGAEEGMEELLSQYINTIANSVIMGDASDIQKYVAQLVANGMSEEDAYRKAMLQYLVIEPGLAALGGAISGAGMSSMGNIVNTPSYIGQIHASKQINAQNRMAGEVKEPIGNELYNDAKVSANGTATKADGGAQNSFADKKVPTYDELIAKPDIEIVDIGSEDYSRPFKEQRSELINGEYVQELYSSPVKNEDTGEMVFVTPASLTHTFSNGGKYRINTIKSIREIIRTAILTHSEKATHGSENTQGVYTLFAATRTPEGVKPVRVKIKEYNLDGRSIPKNIQQYFDENGAQRQYASLYDSKVLVVEEIETEDVSSSALTTASTNETGGKYPSTSSTISIAELVGLVNSDYQKYLPQKQSENASAEVALDIFGDTEGILDDDERERANTWAREDAQAYPSEDISSDVSVDITTPMEKYERTGTYIPDTAEMEMRKRLAATAKTDTEKTGILAGASDRDIRIAEFISEVFGRKVLFMTDAARINGKTKNGIIYINVNGGSVASQALAHELTHTIEASKLYSQLLREVKRMYADQGKSWTELVNEMMNDGGYVELYASEGRKFERGDAEREIVANAIGEMFSDETRLIEFAKNNRNIVTRMLAKIRTILSSISRKNFIGSAEALETAQHYRNIEKLFAKALRQTKRTGEKAAQYSIVSPFIDDNGNKFENAVLLDSTFFNGLSPRNWGKKLKTYVEKRADSQPFIMRITDDNGNLQDLVFARKSDVVSKNGGTPHRALSELYRTNENISKLSVIHIDEIVEVSEESSPYHTSENSHGWFDKDGWLHRNANVINAQNGAIYNITVDIAKTADGRTVLYATKGKIKKVGQTKVSSLTKRGSTSHPNSTYSISQNGDSVKGQYSLARDPERTRAIKMLQDGVSAKQVYEQTGYFVDNQGRIRNDVDVAIDDPAIEKPYPVDDVEKIKEEARRQINSEREQHQKELAYNREYWQAENDKVKREAAIRRADERKAREEAVRRRQAEKERRKRARGGYISAAKIREAVANNTFVKQMEGLWDELKRREAVCDEYKYIDLETASAETAEAARKAREAADDLRVYIRKVGQQKRKVMREDALALIRSKDIEHKWKDRKAGLLYAVNTMARNIEHISGGDEVGREMYKKYFAPISSHVAQATRLKNDVRTTVKALGLDTTVRKGDVLSESAFVQLLGEARDNVYMLKNRMGYINMRDGSATRDGRTLKEWQDVISTLMLENPSISRNAEAMERVDNAIEAFKEIYDNLIKSINATRLYNGYPPIDYRHGYFPHFSSDTSTDPLFARLLEALDWKVDTEGLPTTINGLTLHFRPGMQYQTFDKRRTQYPGQEYNGIRLDGMGAVEGIDRYIEVAANVIFLTEDVQKLRALSDAIRYNASAESIKERIDAIREETDKEESEKESVISSLLSTASTELSNFVVELEEYTNILAGKKSIRDRQSEQLFGRNMYNAMKEIESKVAANMVAINPGSWLTNFIPLTQAGAVLKNGSMLYAMSETIKAAKEDDGFVARSSFLTNRRGSERLIKTKSRQVVDTLATPMSWIDNFVSETIVRARYAENVADGMDAEAAMQEADRFAAELMADRSLGATPTIFNLHNPVAKLFTQYQLEVANQLAWATKDLPRMYGDDKKKLAAAIVKMALYGFLYNFFYKGVTGRDAAADPLGIINDAVGDIFGYAAPDLSDLMAEGFTLDALKKEKKGVWEAMKGVGEAVLEQSPFTAVGGLFFEDFDQGRLPVASAIPNLPAIGDAVSDLVESQGKSWKQGARDMYKEVVTPLSYIAMPGAAGQLNKVVNATDALLQGGSYTYNAEGERQLQYPIYTDEGVASVGTAVKSLAFGKNSTRGGQEWVESGFKTLSAKQTAAYADIITAGEGRREAWELVNVLKAINTPETRTIERVDALAAAPVNDEAKTVAFRAFVSDAEKWDTAFPRLRASGVDFDEFLQIHRTYCASEGDGKKAAVVSAIDSLSLDAKQKDELYLCYYRETGLGDAPWHKTRSSGLSVVIPEIEIPEIPKVELPKVELPKIELPNIGG